MFGLAAVDHAHDLPGVVQRNGRCRPYAHHMIPMLSRAALQPTKTMGASTAGDKQPTTLQRVINGRPDMLIWMFLHQCFPQSIDILLTNVNSKLAK